MKKTLLATMILSAFGLTACGGGDSGSSSSSSSSTTTTALTISGVVNKGIVSNGIINVCYATDNNISAKKCADSESIIDTTTTDDTGSYTLNLSASEIEALADSPFDTPLMVALTSDGVNTTMKCDTAARCGSNEFGTPVVLPTTFKRIAIIAPKNDGSSEVTETSNITSLTHLAAEKAIATANGALSSSVVDAAQQTVVAKLGLTGTIGSIGGVDLTDSSALSGTDEGEIAASVFSASLDVLYDDAGDDADVTDTTSALTLLNDIAADDTAGAADVATVLATVVAEADDVIASVVNLDSSLSGTMADVSTDVQDTNPTAVSSVTAAVVSGATASDIDKAKTLVENLRVIIAAAQDNSDGSAGTIETALSGFEDNTSTLDALVADDMDAINEKLTEAFKAILVSAIGSSEATTYTAIQTGNSYQVTYTDATGSVSLTTTVDAATFGDSGDNYNYNCTEQSDGSDLCTGSASGLTYANLDLTITALTVSENETTLSLPSGTTSTISVSNLSASYSETDSTTIVYNSDNTWVATGTGKEVTDITADSINIDLNSVTISNSANSGSFVGNVEFSMAGIDFYGEDNESGSEGTSATVTSDSFGGTWNGTFDGTMVLSSFGLNIKGEITTSTDDSSNAQLVVNLVNNAGLSFNISDTWTSVWDGYNWIDTSSDDTGSIDETTSSYITGSVSTTLSADLSNTSSVNTSVTMLVSRTSLTSADVKATVIYGNTDTIIETSVDSSEITGTDADEITYTVTNGYDTGVIATITQSGTGEYSGNITVDGTETAVISEDNGIPYIYFYDGTEATEFQSLF